MLSAASLRGGVARAGIDHQQVVDVVAGGQVRARTRRRPCRSGAAFSFCAEPPCTIEASRSTTVIPVSSRPATFSHGNPSGRAASSPHQSRRNRTPPC